ncbi:MAG: CNNM domain-containing protein [Burkholderiaceae bacterium]
MEALPLWAQILILVALLVASGFFSISEISMMAMNRYRLSHMVKQEGAAPSVPAACSRTPSTCSARS